MIPFLTQLLSRFGYWLANSALKWFIGACRWVATNPFVLVMALLLALILAIAGYHQKASKLRTVKQNLHVAGTLVSRLREDSTALKTTINTATASLTINYAQQAQVLKQDSVHAASLSDDQLDAETDSILSANDAYLKQRASRRNQ